MVYDSHFWKIGHHSNYYWWPDNVPRTAQLAGVLLVKSISEQSVIAIASCGIFPVLFRHQDAIYRHLSAPMLREREAYVTRLLSAGAKREFVAERASTLLHVVRLLHSEPSIAISEEEITRAAASRLVETKSEPSTCRSNSKNFVAVSRSWARFLGVYSKPPGAVCHFEWNLAEFVNAMRDELGYLPSSLTSCETSVRRFLTWFSISGEDLRSVSLETVEQFLAERRTEGWRQRTVIGHCRAMRTFFRYAERRGWSAEALSKTIKAPASRARANVLESPPWNGVKKMLASLDSAEPSQCRAKAVLLLASTYGLRRSEIIRLTIEDLDWRNEVLTVRRSKRGRVQQFPLQYEVGEAIIRYLKEVRPRCRYRNLFLTLHTPYRPAVNIGTAMRKVMSVHGAFDRPWGLHALRHACATELLRKGTSLQGIADFLGHRSVQSVSIYAHCDHRALRKVAEMDLSGVL